LYQFIALGEFVLQQFTTPIHIKIERNADSSADYGHVEGVIRSYIAEDGGH
jgi:hypothetical protein